MRKEASTKQAVLDGLAKGERSPIPQGIAEQQERKAALSLALEALNRFHDENDCFSDEHRSF